MINLDRICSKKGCNGFAVHKSSNTGFYCPKHYRFIAMRKKAKDKSKYQPTFEELETFLQLCGNEMLCPICNRKMIWHSLYGEIRNVITLQHNNDGNVLLICYSCNSGHGKSDLGDNYFKIPNNKKYCSNCKRILNKNQFYKDIHRADGIYYICKKCHQEKNRQRYKENKYNARLSK